MTVHWHDDELEWCPCDEDKNDVTIEDVIVASLDVTSRFINGLLNGHVGRVPTMREDMARGTIRDSDASQGPHVSKETKR